MGWAFRWRRRQSLRSSTREELAVAHLAVSVFAVRFAHILRRRHSLSPSTRSFYLSLAFSSSPRFFLPLFPPLFSSSFSRTLALSLLAFRLQCFFVQRTVDAPPVQLVSLVCVCFLYRFPFFVKASDTLIRCVVLFAFLHAVDVLLAHDVTAACICCPATMCRIMRLFNSSKHDAQYCF